MPDRDHGAGGPGDEPPAAPASLYRVAFGGLCPRCGEPTLFAGALRFADRCRACGLDFSAFNVGDGAAAFLTLAIGTIVTVLGIIVELTFEPAWWIHVLLWLPLTIASVMLTARWTKAALAALEWRNNAGEGRIGPPR